MVEKSEYATKDVFRERGVTPRPASHVKLDAEFEARVSQASPQWQNARPKARVLVITALITGSITTHVMRELIPIIEYF